MGLLKHLLFWPVTGPLFLLDFSLGKVDGVVREELTDDSRVKSELMELQLQLELGDIDEGEYVEREAALMRQLREIREWRERFGMGVSGGPVRVQAAGEDAGVGPPPAGASDSPTGRQRAGGSPDPESTEHRSPRVASPNEVTIEFDVDGDR